MPVDNGNEPVEPSEIVYRRVGNGFYAPTRPEPLSPKAFRPLPGDVDGISLTRARYGSSPQNVGEDGFVGREYYVIEISAGDIESIGLTLRPDPLPDNSGHAVIPKLNYASVTVPEVLGLMNAMRQLPYKAHGPFVGKKPKNPA